MRSFLGTIWSLYKMGLVLMITIGLLYLTFWLVSTIVLIGLGMLFMYISGVPIGIGL